MAQWDEKRIEVNYLTMILESLLQIVWMYVISDVQQILYHLIGFILHSISFSFTLQPKKAQLT